MDFKKNMLKNEKLLSNYACKESDAIRLKEIDLNDIRPSYFRDTDRILYSLSFNRYINKTQVHTNVQNDHISKRIIHVQLVSKIARTIGRALNLNEDLIEAMALGHDIGHVPFGHEGEAILNEISLKHNQGPFIHSAQSVRVLNELEKNGEGNNLTIQVLDGILCHNGEIGKLKYTYHKKTIEQVIEEYQKCFQKEKFYLTLEPMTLEGCVLQLSDMISYLGKDVEEAVMLGIITKEDIPDNIVQVLGNNNREIVNSIVLDVINNSYNKNYLKLSEPIFKAIEKLEKFNYEKIYFKSNSHIHKKEYTKMFNFLFDTYLEDIKTKKYKTSIYPIFLSRMNEKYLENNSLERQVIDYLAGMTDNYFINEYNNFTLKDCKKVK